jgi:hypothetical protein
LIWGIYKLCKSDKIENLDDKLTTVTISPLVANLDTVPEDSILTSNFFIHNTGSELLKIKSIYPDCSCISFKVSTHYVNPGDTAILTLSVDTHNKFEEEQISANLKLNTKQEFYRVTMRFYVIDDSDD